MVNDGKENSRHVACKNHTARTERELYRVCPSKLSKRELEESYFSLAENNTQLKKTINGQRDQIKVLTTKVQRMTVQTHGAGSHNKDCCRSSKAIINEQKESIADLKKGNERLSERIRLLNMRLCSAKQFLRRSPGQPAARCPKCCLASNTSFKNSSMTALPAQKSEENLQTDITSCLYLNKDNLSARAAAVVSNHIETKTTADEFCQQNKCRTSMEELKQKIGNLEEELSKTHERYSGQVLKLGEEVAGLGEENLRVRTLQANSEHKLDVCEKEAGELLHKLRDVEMQCDSLATQLQIEKGKVCELETQVRAGDISSQVARALEAHMNTVIVNRKSNGVRSEMKFHPKELCSSDWESNPPKVESNDSEISQDGVNMDMIKISDDSGYVENNKSPEFDVKKEPEKTDQYILDQIANLQAQLDNLKLSTKGTDTGEEKKSDAVVDSIKKDKSDSNEEYTGRVRDASSSLNNDIIQTSRIRPIGQIEQENAPNSKPHIDERKNITSKNGFHDTKQCATNKSSSLDETLNLNESPIDIISKDIEIIGNRININKFNANHNSKEEIFNANGFTKKKISSLRGYNRDASGKVISASYDESKTCMKSTTNIDAIRNSSSQSLPSQRNDIGNVICEPYKNSDSAVKPSEKVNEEEFALDSVSSRKREKCDNANETYIKETVDNKDVGVQNLQEINSLSNSGTASGNSTYVVEAHRIRNKLTKDATFNVINHLDTYERQAHICTYPHASSRDESVFLTPRFSNCAKNKFRQRYSTRGSRTDALKGVIEPELNGSICPKIQEPQPLGSSTPNPQKTYNVEGSAEMTRSASPDNTEHEISSLTDLPIEIEDKSSPDYISPGEEKATTTFTDSYAATTTTDYGSLSEGELPVTEVKNVSFAEVDMKHKSTDSIALSTTSNRMEETLRAIGEELTRCRELLQGQMPEQVIPNLRSGFRFIKYQRKLNGLFNDLRSKSPSLN